jgi:hypothetical protein
MLTAYFDASKCDERSRLPAILTVAGIVGESENLE